MQRNSSSVLCTGWEHRTCGAEKMDDQCYGIFRVEKRKRMSPASTVSTISTKSSSSSSSSNISNWSGESLLVQDLNRLTVKERDYVFQEIHGVAEIPKETPEFVQEKIQELNKELAELPRRKRQALDRAFFLRPGYKTNVKFQLMFLRATRFEPLYAARRMAKHFETKLELWGEENLAKPISLEVLETTIAKVREETDPSHMLKGSSSLVGNDNFFVLPETDQAGRAVTIFTTDGCAFDHPRINVLRDWYKYMHLIETNESAQINGLLDITFWTGSQDFLNLFETIKFGVPRTIMSLPFRYGALHTCWNQGPSSTFNKDDAKANSERTDVSGSMSNLSPQQHRIWENITDFIVKQVDRQDRVRFRTHIGSYLELQYALVSYGIPISFFPSSKPSSTSTPSTQNENSTAKTDSSQKGTQKTRILPGWLQQISEDASRQEREKRPNGFSGIEIEYRYPSEAKKPNQSESDTPLKSTVVTAPGSFVEYPGETDILLGRGRPYQRYAGNVLLSELVDSYRAQYDKTTERLGKVFIAIDILKTLQSKHGSRLLQQKSTGWEIVEDSVGHDKIIALFCHKRALKKSRG